MNYFGEIPLHLAIINLSIKTVNSIIIPRADVNIKDFSNNSVLHIACSKNYYKCMKLLIDNGANLCMTNPKGETPLSCIKDFLPNSQLCLFLLIKKSSILLFNRSLMIIDLNFIQNSEIAFRFDKDCTSELEKIISTKFFMCYSHFDILILLKKIKYSLFYKKMINSSRIFWKILTYLQFFKMISKITSKIR